MIDNVLHFVYLKVKNSADFSIINYLCVKSAVEVNNPDNAFLYYDEDQTGEWWEKLKSVVTMVKLNKDEIVSEVFGNKVTKVEHKADVIRLRKLSEFGGIYLDTDILCLKPFLPLLDNTMVLGREGNSSLCNAVVMSEPDSKFLLEWYNSYKNFDGSKWNEQSVMFPYKLWKEKYEYTSNITVVPKEFFFYPGYRTKGLKMLFEENLIFDDAFCFHLWDHASRKRFLNNLSEEDIKNNDTTVNIELRKYL